MKKNHKKSVARFPFRFSLDLGRAGSMMMTMALSYSVFLLLCLILCVQIFNSSMKNARDRFWSQNHAIFSNAVTVLDGYFSSIESCCRQLSQNDSFYRLADMTGTDSTNFYFTAMQNKKNISTYLYTPSMAPVDFYYIYLRNTDYVLSTNQFESGYVYYKGSGFYYPDNYENWKDIMQNPDHPGTIYDISAYSRSEDGGYMYLLDMDELTYRNIAATVCFRLSTEKLSYIFRDLSLSDSAFLLALNPDGREMFSIGQKGLAADASASLTGLSFSGNVAQLRLNDSEMHVSRYVSEFNGWQYYLVQPHSLYASQAKDYTPLFRIVLFAVGAFGIVFIILLAHRTVRPVRLLNDELEQTISDKESLQKEIEEQKPIIQSSYVRQLMLGTVTNEDEAAYIRDYLGLSDRSLRFSVLYMVVYNNGSSGLFTREETSQLITQALQDAFGGEMPFYLYTPKERIYALLICTRQDASDSLLTLQSKVLHLHDSLLENHDIWLFAGAGRQTGQLFHIWESYHQAQEAAGYSAKNYIFLPYEVIQKDSGAFYYPPELSNALLHFVATGNKAQVTEIFNLIHKENMEDRSLPNNLLMFLLSDIRNTLLRARFSVTDIPKDKEALAAAIDRLFNDHLSFKLCEDIAFKLCEFFAASADEPDLIRTIVAYIREHYQDPSISLNKISDEFHISESYFSHMFKEKCGVNFSVYLEDLRLNEAARLIREEDCGISELYMKVGYNNPGSFRRAFKKKFGVLPSAFKNG